MAMSTDRVHFELDLFHLDAYTREAYTKTFGISPPSSRFHGSEKITIICRPSQFARFLIYRNDAGGKNAFKELNARLVEANPDTVIDLSHRPKAAPV